MREGQEQPSYDRYVAGLPGGLAAYPEAQAKGSIVRSLIEAQPEALHRALPEPVRALAVDPPIDSDWVPEAHVAALIHAIGEIRGYTASELGAWARACNRTLFASPLYRILMAVASPEALLRHAGRRWTNFHRGSTLCFDGFSDDGVRLTLRFPGTLFDGVVLRTFAEAFAAALEANHVREPLVHVEVRGPGFARYLARW